jgi:hypothetical protein
MHGPINVKSPNNTSKWQMGFNSAFKGLSTLRVEHVEIKKQISQCVRTNRRTRTNDEAFVRVFFGHERQLC